MTADQNMRTRTQSIESIKNQIVALAENPGEAIAGLYHLLKSRDKKHSLGFICRASRYSLNRIFIGYMSG